MSYLKLTMALLVVCAGVVVGCASKDSIVIGNWTGAINQGGSSVKVNPEFFSDKSVIIKVDGQALPSGKWSILSDGRVKIDGDMMYAFLTGGSTTIFGEIQGRSLILDFGTNGKVTFTK